ncbi:hypothetical protein ABZW18_26265 [Streptomyces sp. NPDC004647]|uniref:hypothetical protein n=1 Tax=Streptomyces sp. NPDC004647 TaxID=3154671 RepID=UPI0033ACA7C9
MKGDRSIRFRHRYGEGPLHLVLLTASFALTGYAGVRLLEGDWLAIGLWFVGSALVHDLVLLPLYALADRALLNVPGVRHREWLIFVRVPAVLSGLLLLVWFPLITRRVERYEQGTGLPADVFLPRWLLVTALLFLCSALWLLTRAQRRRHRRTGVGSDTGAPQRLP